ncbi:hypothetical protein BCR44DRAFT_316997 [Catenaria anguillulae PL171]|uniref:Uncharacterized protein n=1 Tax=Catenaria anguillulae PL171 TaxID=765915 RepID=A0A1Y2H610_9FUNG|nr:hypothetical protein BCR44DRAFT_316997 [Catenaria anguillulae PL171]
MSVISRHASRQMPLSPARLMANGHRSFHYFAGCMSGSPSNIFKLLPSSDAKQLYEADIRPLVEPRWGRQNHRDFQSERTRMFISGFCAALDFVPVLAKVNRWSAAYMPGQIDVTSLPESYLKMREFPGAITPPQTVDTTIFKMAKLVAAKLQATGMSGTRNTDDGNMTYPTSIYHSLASLLAPVYSEFTGQICWRHPDASGSYYPESAMAHHLQSFFTGLLGTVRPVLMSCEVEYPCYKGWNFFRIIRGVADLAICMRTDRECGFQSETHAITSLVGELKSDPSIGSAFPRADTVDGCHDWDRRDQLSNVCNLVARAQANPASFGRVHHGRKETASVGLVVGQYAPSVAAESSACFRCGSVHGTQAVGRFCAVGELDRVAHFTMGRGWWH